MATFDDATVLVTGASRGVGRAIAAAFGARGAFVFVGYNQRRDGADETVAQIEAAGGAGEALALDVRDRQAAEAAVERAVQQRGAVDVLVNNAGVVRDDHVSLMEAAAWDEVLAVNLTGVFNCSRAALQPMMAAGRGVIVNVASVAGLHASPGQANYAASKGGVVALTRTMAAEVAKRGVRVNAVALGLLSTGMAARLDHRVARRQTERIPLGRFGTAEEAAAAVLFLASDEASYLVGQTMVVDGGLSL